MPRSLQLAASLLALAAAASLTEPTQACTQPTVSITSPPDGALLSGLSTLAVSFVVHCAAFPGDVFVRLWEVSTRAADTFVDLIAPGDAYIMNIIEGARGGKIDVAPPRSVREGTRVATESHTPWSCSLGSVLWPAGKAQPGGNPPVTASQGL